MKNSDYRIGLALVWTGLILSTLYLLGHVVAWIL